jgi:indole-3-glycerol phosphate synthase
VNSRVPASSHWTPPIGTLGRIVAEAEARAAALESAREALTARAARTPVGPSLERAMATARDVSILAEVKRRSPSKGLIAASLGAVEQSDAYRAGGAIGVSILTEPVHFGGCNDDLTAVRAAVGIPVLKKDFHVRPIQLLEARALGASAALIIVRALSPERLVEMMEAGRPLGLELLAEVRDVQELERALDAGATLIGVNNRDLETLEIDATTAERIVPLIPRAVTAIAESGVRSRAEVERYAACGADAVLVGSSLSAAADPAAATRALTGVPRRPRAR